MRPTLLIVADSEFVRLALAAAMQSEEGINVVGAKNGKEALDTLTALGNVEAVVLEVNLPLLDGREVLRRMKQQRRHFPFVVAVGDDGPSLEDCRELGANEILPKPFDVEVLRGLVLRAMGRPNTQLGGRNPQVTI